MKRIESIDALRGLVMIIMAIDHCRDLIHVDAIAQSPTDLATTYPALFFTRWITHLCAPTFVFLSGASVYLSMQKQNDLAGTRRFLISRGLWLVLLEFTVIGFGVWFDIKFRTFMFQVIGTIGIGFILLSLCLKLSSKTIGIIGVFIIALHDLIPLLPLQQLPVLKATINFLFGVTFINITKQVVFFSSYPVIPWLGIMMAGFGFGKIFLLDKVKSKKTLLTVGSCAILLFILLRMINIYGDPAPWASQKNAQLTFLSFMNVSKYPPSLLFTLIMLGITIGFLGIIYHSNGRVVRLLSTYGKVPFFYYLLHWYIIHSILLIILFAQGYSWQTMDFSSFRFGRPNGPSGLSLPAVYAIWAGVILLLYPICKWYGNYRAKHPEKWFLRYL